MSGGIRPDVRLNLDNIDLLRRADADQNGSLDATELGTLTAGELHSSKFSQQDRAAIERVLEHRASAVDLTFPTNPGSKGQTAVSDAVQGDVSTSEVYNLARLRLIMSELRQSPDAERSRQLMSATWTAINNPAGNPAIPAETMERLTAELIGTLESDPTLCRNFLAGLTREGREDFMALLTEYNRRNQARPDCEPMTVEAAYPNLTAAIQQSVRR